MAKSEKQELPLPPHLPEMTARFQVPIHVIALVLLNFIYTFYMNVTLGYTPQLGPFITYTQAIFYGLWSVLYNNEDSLFIIVLFIIFSVYSAVSLIIYLVSIVNTVGNFINILNIYNGTSYYSTFTNATQVTTIMNNEDYAQSASTVFIFYFVIQFINLFMDIVFGMGTSAVYIAGNIKKCRRNGKAYGRKFIASLSMSYCNFPPHFGLIVLGAISMFLYLVYTTLSWISMGASVVVFNPILDAHFLFFFLVIVSMYPIKPSKSFVRRNGINESSPDFQVKVGSKSSDTRPYNYSMSKEEYHNNISGAYEGYLKRDYNDEVNILLGSRDLNKEQCSCVKPCIVLFYLILWIVQCTMSVFYISSYTNFNVTSNQTLCDTSLNFYDEVFTSNKLILYNNTYANNNAINFTSLRQVQGPAPPLNLYASVNCGDFVISWFVVLFSFVFTILYGFYSYTYMTGSYGGFRAKGSISFENNRLVVKDAGDTISTWLKAFENNVENTPMISKTSSRMSALKYNFNI